MTFSKNFAIKHKTYAAIFFLYSHYSHSKFKVRILNTTHDFDDFDSP